MTDFVLQANESSTLLRDLNSKPRVDLSYSVKPSYPLISKKFFSIASESTIGTPAGSTVVFKLPRAGLLRDLLIQSTVSTAAASTNVLTTPWGLDLFESIEIRTNNKVIYTQSDAACKAFSQHTNLGKQGAIYRRALPTVPTTGAIAAAANWNTTGVTVYTPVFAPFFESVYNFIDLNFWEPISLHCKVSTTARMGLYDALSAMTSYLWVWTYTPDAEYYNKLRSKNMSPEYPLNMLCYNTFLEKFTCTSTTQNTMRLNVNYPVTALYFFVKHISTGALFQINSFDFIVAGSKILDAVPWLVADYASDCSGSTAVVPTWDSGTSTFPMVRITDQNRIRWLQFNMDPFDNTYNSGAMSFNNLLTPTLVINTASLGTASNYEIHVVYKYMTIVSFDATNGSVSVAQNS